MTETRTPESGRKAPPTPPVSYDEFLEWADENVRAEWIDGAIQTTKPASTLHQRIVRFLSGVLSAWVEERKAGEVFVAPFQMKLEERPSGREPDVLVVTESHLNRVQETHLGGPADVVFEVVSAESGPRDRGDKFYEYEAAGIPGVLDRGSGAGATRGVPTGRRPIRKCLHGGDGAGRVARLGGALDTGRMVLAGAAPKRA